VLRDWWGVTIRNSSNLTNIKNGLGQSKWKTTFSQLSFQALIHDFTTKPPRLLSWRVEPGLENYIPTQKNSGNV